MTSKQEIMRARIQTALDRQANSIPVEVRLAELPSDDVLDVTSIPASSGLLTARELQITGLSASDLVGLMARQVLSSAECTMAFVKRAGIATQLVNCCTEICADEAMARARELDAHLRRTGETVGPLHGLPVSIKEHILWAGKVVHCSYVGWLDNVEPDNALVLDALLECGAVPFCRTPQPQSVMQLETNSNIYGQTLNPFDRRRTPGGSSGGESALLGMRGSPMGVGGDIGGSIRNPAALCGLYGFKPTTLRTPGGTKGLHKGRETVLGTNGPLCQSRADMRLYMTSVLSREPWLREPSIVPMPWRDVPRPAASALTVAIMWTDGVVKPLAPVTRALTRVAEAMGRASINVVDWEAKDHADSWDIISSLYYTNNAEDEHAFMEQHGESMLPLTKWLTEQPGVKYRTYDENNDLLLRRNAYRTMYANHWLAQEKKAGRKIDVILCPVSPGPAPKLGTSKYWTYTSVWNLLDYPGAVFPVTKVESGDVDSTFVPAHGSEREIWESYSAEECAGLPICLQLVGRRYQEEALLASLDTIEECAMGVKSTPVEASVFQK